jgi:hypothetical protein
LINERKGWDIASVSIAALSCALLLIRWPRLPVFSDSWYHLSVIRAFAENGFTLHAWWEFAPFGRPHLYSPLFHLVNAGILRMTGCALLDLARLYDVVTFPAVILAGWWAARSLFGQRPAFITALLLALNIGLLFPCSLIMMPGTYALLLWPFLQIAANRNRWLHAGVLLATMCWLHFGMAIVAVASLLVLAAFRREHFKPVLLVIAAALVVFSPWLVHLCRHREFLHSGTANLPVFVPVFTLAGAALAIRKREAVPVWAMLLASALFLFTLRERFWTYGGFLFAILGGAGLDRFAKWVVPVLVASCLSVTPFLKPATLTLALPVVSGPGYLGAPLLTLARWPGTELPADMMVLMEWIEKNTNRDEVLMTDDRLLGESVFALTGRRTTCGLWSEVMTNELTGKLAAYNRTGRGYIIVTGDDVPDASSFVVAFGRFKVFRRPAGV